jgi:uncharacterized membrane protein YbhN (UPF0104 family)
VALAISATLLWLAMRSAPIDEIARTLRSTSPQWLCVGLAFYWLEMLVRVQRWRLLLRGLAPFSFGQVMIPLVVGYAANNALPARLGELFRADFIGRRYGVSRLSVLGTIFVERLFDMIVVLVCAIAGIALAAGQRSGHPFYANMIHGLVATAVIAGLSVGFLYVATNHLPDRLAWRRFPWLRHATDAIVVGLRSARRPGLVVATAALSLPIWLLSGLAMYSVLVAVGVSPSPRSIVLLLGLAGIAAAIPAAPASIGTLQFAYMLGLAPDGHPASAAFAAASLVQLVLLGSVTLAGAVIYLATQLMPRRAPPHV